MTPITMRPMDKCPIWPDFEATIHLQLREQTLIVESARAGGNYEIDALATDLVGELDLRACVRLTTWLVDQRRMGSWCPKVTPEIVEYAKVKRALYPHERAARLLSFVIERTETIATVTYIHLQDGEAYAWSESAEENELEFLIKYLTDEKMLDSYYDPVRRRFECRVTMEGYRQIAGQEVDQEVDQEVGQKVHVVTTQAFVAMWLHDSMDDAFESGIKPAIEAAGYKPLRIDQKPDANKIDDDIIAEIQRSGFLVADFTHGEEGARGSVYFEAGYAHGLSIPVIYTCRNDMVDKLHFDTRQYAHIVWETPEELRSGLLNRIRARFGEGPGANFTA